MGRGEFKEVERSPDDRYVRVCPIRFLSAHSSVSFSLTRNLAMELTRKSISPTKLILARKLLGILSVALHLHRLIPLFQVDLRRLPDSERERVRAETEILKSLNHPHIIKFYAVWEDLEKQQVCFITEIVTSGTLKQYTSRVKGIKLKVIKKWCRQILNGLDYLHSHHPPIIHRDLKCDNIFINGNTGQIRIGDFGLSATRTETQVHSVLGTPEFMAPELYDESYSEKVDIYAFGMCVLEMVTKEYPYEECTNAAQIYKRVCSGMKPEVLSRIADPAVRDFIDICLAPQERRLSAHELLKHPFLRYRNWCPQRELQPVIVCRCPYLTVVALIYVNSVSQMIRSAKMTNRNRRQSLNPTLSSAKYHVHHARSWQTKFKMQNS